LNIFIRFGDIRRRTSKSSEIGPNFACFLLPKFFWVAPPEILERHYKIGYSTYHRAKFHAGRPTHLGDFASGEKKSPKPNVSPPGALSPIEGTIKGTIKGAHIPLVAKSHGPNFNAYAERAVST